MRRQTALARGRYDDVSAVASPAWRQPARPVGASTGDVRFWQAGRTQTGALALIAVLFLLVGVAKPPTLLDEGLIDVAGQRMLHGDVPYRDFFAPYPPGQFVALALLFKTFGANLLTARLWDVAVQVALVLAVFGVTRLLVRGPAAFVSALLVLLWLGSVSFPNYPIYAALLFTLTGCLLLARYLSSGERRWLALAGLMVGLAAVFRHDVGAYAVAAFGLVITLSTPDWAGLRDRRWGPLARSVVGNLASFLAGVAVCTVPMVAYLLALVPVQRIWGDLFEYTMQIAPAIRAQPSPSLLPTAEELGEFGPAYTVVLFIGWIRFHAPLAVYALWAVGGVYLLTRRARARVDRVPFWTTVLVYLLGILLFGQTRIIKDWAHLIPTSIFALILLCAGVQRLTLPISVQWRRRAGLLAFTILVVPYVVLPAIFWEVDVRSIWTRPCPWTIETSGCASVPPDLAEAVQHVRATVEPGRPIFVGNTRNDWLWGSAIVFYFLADRPSATRFQQLEPGMSTTDAAQTEMVRDIERRGVTHVVLYSGFDDRIPQHRIGSTILDDFIQSRYRPAAQFGEYAIWERTP